jgi:hypothetical protein
VGAEEAVVARALAYLRGLQRADGSIAYSSSSAQTPVWVTAQALMALAREPLPVATVPRRKRRTRASAVEAPAAPAEPAGKSGRGARPKADAEPPRAKPKRSARKREEAVVAAEPGGARPLEEAVETPVGPSPTRASKTAEEDDRVPLGLVAVAVAATLAALALVRRLLPRRLRRSGGAAS